MAETQIPRSETRWRDLRTGLVFTAGLVLVAVLGLVIGKNTGLLTGHDTAHLFLEDIRGLTEGNMVAVSGKKVGTVAAMRFEAHHDTSGIRVDLDIQEEYFRLISEDSRAVVKSLGVLGDKYVDIQLGSSPRQLADGGWLTAIHAPGMEELTASALQTMGEVGGISARINRGEGTIGRLIVSNELADKMVSTVSNLEQLTNRLRKGEGLAGKVLTDRRLADDALAFIGHAKEIVAGLRSGQGTAGRLLTDSTLYLSAERTVARSDSLLTRIGAPGGSTGRLIHDPALYQDLTQAVRSLDSLLIDLREHPERYVRISVF